MTIQATCPKGHKLKLDDKMAGKKIRCPRCQTSFGVPDLDGEEDDRPRRGSREDDDEEEDEDEDERPARRRNRDGDDDEDDDRPKKKDKKKVKAKAKADEYDDDEIREGEERLTPEERLKLRRKERKALFGWVAFGLQLHFIKFVILLVALCLGILGFILSLAIFEGIGLRPDQNRGEFEFLFGLSFPELVIRSAIWTATLVAPIVGIVGSFFCFYTPRGASTRVLVVSSMVFDTIPVICSILRLLFRNVWNDIETGKLNRLDDYLELISSVSMVLGWLYFMVYLRTLGAYIGMPGTGNEALNLIAFLVVQVITAPVNFIVDLFAFRMITGALGSTFALILVILLILGWVVFLYFFLLIGMINLLTKLRAGVLKKT